MPEGPEIALLSKALNMYYNDNTFSSAYGKHLYLLKSKEDWSFGLSGTVHINERNELVKDKDKWVSGNIRSFNPSNSTNSTNPSNVSLIASSNKLGINWLSSSKQQIHAIVQQWVHSKKTLASLMLDQSQIAGIGVAWGSEILFQANLSPELKAIDQFTDASIVNHFVTILAHVGTHALYQYDLYLSKAKDKQELKTLIQDWYHNLYSERTMHVYKKGKKRKVGGRSWWV